MPTRFQSAVRRFPHCNHNRDIMMNYITSCISQVHWAARLHGRILASASSSGEVCLWRQEETAAERSGDGGEGGWRLDASFFSSTHAVTALVFGPAEAGLCLAAASLDGGVRYARFAPCPWHSCRLVLQTQCGSLLVARGERPCWTEAIPH